MFRAEWQHSTPIQCINNLSTGEAFLCMDYVLNYVSRFQSEVPSAFFDQAHVTLHPMMASYKQAHNTKDLLVKHVIICVTDDRWKDASGVKEFENEVINIIETETGKTVTSAWIYRWLCCTEHGEEWLYGYLHEETSTGDQKLPWNISWNICLWRISDS